MELLSHSLPPASLTALTEAAAAINSTLDVRTVLSTIAELARSVTHAEASTVFSLDPRRSKLVVVSATGHWRDAMIDREFSADLGIPGGILRTAEPVVLADVRQSRRFCKEIDEISSTRTQSLMAAPMIHRAEVIGVIEVVNRTDQLGFSETDLKILQIFAMLAATASQNARAHHDLQRRFDSLRDSVLKRTPLIGESACWKEAIALCDRVARSSATVLLLGETGTGKELAARYIHNCSTRCDESFVAVNCTALPETLLESELFGHEKGSFTGAHTRRHGWFEVAGGGTLFLDEIGEIGRPMQAKLLRVLQEKRIVRVGGTQSLPCDARVIAATNRNLKNMMIDGLFREDLYYRLSVFPIPLPPLRERRDDIHLFVDHFVAQAARDCNVPGLRVAPSTLAALTEYDWPGNVRELQNVVERSVLMSDGDTLLPCHLPPDIAEAGRPENTPALDETTLAGQERALVLKALKEHNWNQSRAARALGITRYHVRHRMKKYGIDRPSDSGV
ncbi:MAG: sigma 54-interacting transcriptional regulator [Phycisphaerae bacterium]